MSEEFNDLLSKYCLICESIHDKKNIYNQLQSRCDFELAFFMPSRLHFDIVVSLLNFILNLLYSYVVCGCGYVLEHKHKNQNNGIFTNNPWNIFYYYFFDQMIGFYFYKKDFFLRFFTFWFFPCIFQPTLQIIHTFFYYESIELYVNI